MIIKATDQLYTQALELFTGKQRNRLNGTDLNVYNAGVSSPLLLYVAPTYDTATHKLGVLIEIPDGECTYTTPAKTQAELDADLLIERQGMIVTPAQFRLQLNSTNKRQDVEDYVAALPKDDQDRWFHAQDFKRLHPMIITLGTELGFSATALDNFFRSAALIEV